MKIVINMKTPDAVDRAVDYALEAMPSEEWEAMGDADGEREDEDAVNEAVREALKGILSKWFRNGEYLKVEVDTETKTCKVVENKP